MRAKLLAKIADFADRRAAFMFGIALVVTLIAAALMQQLKIEMHFKNLMPQKHPMVQEFNQIVDDFSTATLIIVAARGDETELKQFADELAPQIEAMTDYVQRVDYKLERDFYLKHGFMLQKAKDLKNSKDIYKDLSLTPMLSHINDSFEKTYVYDQQSISTKERENNAILFLDGVQSWLQTIGQYASDGDALPSVRAKAAVERFLIGDEYLLSQDKDMLLLFAQPTFSLNEVDKVIAAEDTIDAVIHRIAEKYPSVFAGTTGTMALARDETVAFNEDAYLTSLIAFALIIALFIISFRMWVAPIIAGLSLIFGIIWTGGFVAMVIGRLNIMTSMFAVILLGLGVDFSIHIISVYTENRAVGHSIGESLRQALLKSGNGVITGGLTTACAFLTLTVSETAGMREFGIVAGSGVIFCMLAAILVLPAMLSLRDKILIKFRKEKYIAKSTEFRFLGTLSVFFSRKPRLVLIGGLIITGVLLYSATQITFDYNYLNMEPVGLTSIKLQDEMEEEFDVTPDFALITTSSIAETRKITEAVKKLKMIGMVTSISEYVPSRVEQQKRIAHIQEIHDNLSNNRTIAPLSEENLNQLYDELYRVEDNVVELAQLAFLGGQDKVDQKCKQIIGDLEDPDNKTMISFLIEKLKANRAQTVENLNLFQQHYEPHFRHVALGMASTAPISVEDLPENILNRFASHDGKKFLLTIYPKQGVFKNIEFLERFTRQMEKIDERVTGIPTIFYILMGIIAKDGKTAASLTLLVVFLLLLWDFKNLKFTVLAMVPLVVGVIWMVGLMHLFGLQMTMMNVIGIPLILGIGIDDGVHLLHRYRVEGAGKIRTVFTSTGKAVMLTSLTTMLAFGSLLFATYRGLGSMGIALFIGVATCFLTSIIILPALLGLVDPIVAKAGG
jgi:uncharacterized protein